MKIYRAEFCYRSTEEYCETYADNGMKYYEGSYGDIFVSEIELDKGIWND